MAVSAAPLQANMQRTLAEVDPEVYALLHDELERQRGELEMIASENFTIPAVLEAAGSTLTNKYAEGYPGKRWYGGCEVVDKVERLAIERAKELFGAEHVNVQPHSGASANLAAYLACVKPGDRILGMRLDHGGHLTHGSPVNISGLWFEFAAYGVGADGRIDMEQVRRQAVEFQPKMIVCGASAYPRIIDFAGFRAIADEVGAIFMADIAHIAGLVAAGVHPSSVPHAHITTTTTHKTLGGPRSGMIMCTADLGPAIDKAVFPGTQGGPLMHIVAAKAVALGQALTPEFRAYAQQVVHNCAALADELVGVGVELVSGGTDNHLVLVDLRPAGVTGKEATERLKAAGITVNKNQIPDDPKSPFVTSGIRVGTAALTSRGMGEGEMREIARIIGDALHAESVDACAALAPRSRAIADRFPLYPTM